MTETTETGATRRVPKLNRKKQGCGASELEAMLKEKPPAPEEITVATFMMNHIDTIIRLKEVGFSDSDIADRLSKALGISVKTSTISYATKKQKAENDLGSNHTGENASYSANESEDQLNDGSGVIERNGGSTKPIDREQSNDEIVKDQAAEKIDPAGIKWSPA